MKYSAAFALLLTLTGAPVGRLACVAWCVPAAHLSGAACHHAMAATGIKAASDDCGELFATAPFVREETQQTAPAVPASVPSALLVVAMGEAQLAGALHTGSTAHRSAPTLVLRL